MKKYIITEDGLNQIKKDLGGLPYYQVENPMMILRTLIRYGENEDDKSDKEEVNEVVNEVDDIPF